MIILPEPQSAFAAEGRAVTVLGGIYSCPGHWYTDSGEPQDMPWLGQGMWVRLVRRPLVSILAGVILGNKRRL